MKKKWLNLSLCELDDYAINVNDLVEYDKDLQRFLAFNPTHNRRMNKENNLGFTDEDIDSFDRDIIETDRSGWRGYHKIYSKHLSHLKNEPIKLLEIGIEEGWGLLAWRRYFTNAEIYGMEKRKNWRQFYEELKEKYPEANDIHFITDASSANQEKWQKHFTPDFFNVIIDDGSHQIEVQRETLSQAWHYLKPGGYYFIEDIKYDFIGIESAISDIIDKIKSLGEFEIYRHINIEKVVYLNMSEDEKVELLTKKLKYEYPTWTDQEVEYQVNRRLAYDIDNPYNYSVYIRKPND